MGRVFSCKGIGYAPRSSGLPFENHRQRQRGVALTRLRHGLRFAVIPKVRGKQALCQFLRDSPTSGVGTHLVFREFADHEVTRFGMRKVIAGHRGGWVHGKLSVNSIPAFAGTSSTENSFVFSE